MSADRSGCRFLLDEHYPAWLADELGEGGVGAEAVLHLDDLRGRPDLEVLRWAVAERRLLVTEDVRTMPAAIRAVPAHAGVIFCPSRRFGRDRAGLERLRSALLAFALEPPEGAGSPGFVWWLTPDAA